MGVHEDILQFEMKLNKLRISYDQYFAAIIKIPPFKLQEEIKRFIKIYSARHISNTALNFKYNSLVSRYTTYNNLWSRHLRELDEGKIKRGHQKVHVKDVKKSGDESQAEKIYKEFVSAREGLKQKTDGIQVKAIEEMLRKQSEQIISKYKCSGVDFKVAVEGGKAKIKAIPKK